MKREILYKCFDVSSLVSKQHNNALHEVVICAVGTAVCVVLYKYVATGFDQLHGHPQATRAHKTKVTISNLILGQNVIKVLLLHGAYR
jgi:hypothetical protein